MNTRYDLPWPSKEYIICVYWVILKIFLGNSEINAAAVLLRSRTPWIYEKTVVWDPGTFFRIQYGNDHCLERLSICCINGPWLLVETKSLRNSLSMCVRVEGNAIYWVWSSVCVYGRNTRQEWTSGNGIAFILISPRLLFMFEMT
jgi:hypothetical protein